MARTIDSDLEEKTKAIICRRFKQLRKSAGMTIEQAAQALGYANATQVSLCESGSRMWPVYMLLKICDKFAVSMDYLTGRISDPIAEPFEVTQGVITSVVQKTISESFEAFAACTAERTAVAISAYRQDRVDIQTIIAGFDRLHQRYERMKELNPDFDDDITGAANFESELNRMRSICMSANARISDDNRFFRSIQEPEIIDSEVKEKVLKSFADLA